MEKPLSSNTLDSNGSFEENPKEGSSNLENIPKIHVKAKWPEKSQASTQSPPSKSLLGVKIKPLALGAFIFILLIGGYFLTPNNSSPHNQKPALNIKPDSPLLLKPEDLLSRPEPPNPLFNLPQAPSSSSATQSNSKKVMPKPPVSDQADGRLKPPSKPKAITDPKNPEYWFATVKDEKGNVKKVPKIINGQMMVDGKIVNVITAADKKALELINPKNANDLLVKQLKERQNSTTLYPSVPSLSFDQFKPLETTSPNKTTQSSNKPPINNTKSSDLDDFQKSRKNLNLNIATPAPIDTTPSTLKSMEPLRVNPAPAPKP